MTTIAIHQPNYLPWLGYFAKISAVDTFVFLDDAAFSKGSYTNRVQFLCEAKSRWLTVPIRHRQGSLINEISPSNQTWWHSHIDSLANWYKKTSGFSEVREDFEGILSEASSKNNLAEINKFLIIKLAQRLDLRCRFINSSEFNMTASGTERLVEIVRKIDPNGRYLSGQGGAKYQDPSKFSEAGIRLKYLDFKHPLYPQNTEDFIPGLSIMDAIFSLGWNQVKELLKSARSSKDE